MALRDLLARIESGAVTSVTPVAIPAVTLKPLPAGACTAVTPVTAANDVMASEMTAPADVRIERVVDRLHGDPGLRFAVEAHIDVDPDAVILTLAIRDKAACELRIPRDKYDPFLLLELIERHSGTVQ
jgi:hypothetical protein